MRAQAQPHPCVRQLHTLCTTVITAITTFWCLESTASHASRVAAPELHSDPLLHIPRTNRKAIMQAVLWVAHAIGQPQLIMR